MVEKHNASIRNRIHGDSLEWNEAAALINNLGIVRLGLACLLILGVTMKSVGSEVIDDYPYLTTDVSVADGSLVLDIAGKIWTISKNGRLATQLTGGAYFLSRPRWSKDGTKILVHAKSGSGMAIMYIDLAARKLRPLVDSDMNARDAAWHPDGERVIFALDGQESQLDIWEVDLPTGLTWRLTNYPGDETSPAWSKNGLHLAWVNKINDRYALILRRYGEADTTVLESVVPISSLSWRPDDSLITFLRHSEKKVTLEMAILADPVVVKTIDDSENHVAAPVSWRDRMTLFYTADGSIRTRNFEDKRSQQVHFRALIVE